MKHLHSIRFINVFLLCIFVSLPGMVLADTYIINNINENTVWSISGSPYVLTGKIHVYQNVSLTIESGVEVRFNRRAELIIGGELKAVGASDSFIKFTSNSATPLKGDWIYINFVNTAVPATYQSNFEYDYDNNQILLNYISGSILEYCIIEYADIGINCLEINPCIKNNIIRNCYTGVSINSYHADTYIPTDIEKWLYFYGNTVEKCKEGLVLITRGNHHAIISGNTFQENEQSGITSPSRNDGGHRTWSSGMMLFNNQFINNTKQALMIDGYTIYAAPPFVFLEHNNITYNGKGVQVLGHLVALHNYICNNRLLSSLDPYRYQPSFFNGAGLDLGGPAAYLFKNTIQQNGVDTGGHGDGIYLQTSDFHWDDLNTFIIRHNILGNSVWDQFDIYIEPDNACSWSKELEVDARDNYWMTSNPSDAIYDSQDDACAGTAYYEPFNGPLVIPMPLPAHPTLLSPENYSEFERPSRYPPTGFTSINFSWAPAPEATKYLLCTYGYAYLGSGANNIVEVTDGTSADIAFYTYHNDGDYLVHWFVVAGNETGWGLPSEIKHIAMVKAETTNTNDEVSQNDSSDGEEGGGCFIENVANGSSMVSHVKIMREFRDRILLQGKAGRTFIKLYYTCSPHIDKFIFKHDKLRLIVRLSLLPFVGMSWVALNF